MNAALQTRDEGPASSGIFVTEVASRRIGSSVPLLLEAWGTAEIVYPGLDNCANTQELDTTNSIQTPNIITHATGQGPLFDIESPASLVEIHDISKINPNYLLNRVRVFYEYSCLDVGLNDRDRLCLEFLLSLGLDRAVAAARLDDLKEFVERQSSREPTAEFGKAASAASDTTQVAKPRGSKRLKTSAKPYEPREFYDQRPDKSMSASEFLMQTWGDLHESGELYQHRLKETDPKLVKALKNQFAGRTHDLRALLKSKLNEVHERFERAYGPDVTADARSSLINKIAPSKLQR